MTKAREKNRKSKKGGKALIGRVKKAIKKSRRQLNDERFRKELQRTIKFLEEIKSKINHGPAAPKQAAQAAAPARAASKSPAKPKPREVAKASRKASQKSGPR